MTGIRLRHLAFTGDPGVGVASLGFRDGLNIVYGASNTGKSFVVRALDFMLGGSSPLPGIGQRGPYTDVWLGLALGGNRTATLYRGTSGGASKLYEGLVIEDDGRAVHKVLQPQHDRLRSDNVSRFMLDAIGLDGKVAAKNAQGEKESVSIRAVAPYMLVDEETIISARSPVRTSGQHIRQTFEANVLKLLLTGTDDSALVTALKPKAQRTARNAKLEVLDELIEQAKQVFRGAVPDRGELERQCERLDGTLASLRDDLHGRQTNIDTLVKERRRLADLAADVSARLGEVELMIDRYAGLDRIYSSDIDRLAAIEESGYALMALTGRDCAVCGAPPEAQRITHGVADLAVMRTAATAEIGKIESERSDLRKVEASLRAEAVGLRSRRDAARAAMAEVEAGLEGARPQEATLRESYEQLVDARDVAYRRVEDRDRLDRLVERRDSIAADRAAGAQAAPVSVGVDGRTSFLFSETMREVLGEWGFPQAGEVRFDPSSQDFLVGGKERGANGKGVRAILHAAFKVAIMLFCYRNGTCQRF